MNGSRDSYVSQNPKGMMRSPRLRRMVAGYGGAIPAAVRDKNVDDEREV
jgi:hypothetical protein